MFPESVGDLRDRIDADGASRREEEVHRRARDAREVGQLGESGSSGRQVGDKKDEMKVWHEAASKVTEQRLTVGACSVRGLTLQVGGDKRPPQFVPDKSGKPRQSHIGY